MAMEIRALNSSCFSEDLDKIRFFGERIATPACALARNDRLLDSFRRSAVRADCTSIISVLIFQTSFRVYSLVP